MDFIAQGVQVVLIVSAVSVEVYEPVFFVDDLPVVFSEKVSLGVVFVELLVVDTQQANQRVAGQDVEVDVWKRLQLVDGLRRRYQSEKQAELGYLASLLHDVHAEEVFCYDLALDVVVDAFVFAANVGQLVF